MLIQANSDGSSVIVLTMTDHFSKYVEDKFAVSVVRGIYKVYCRQDAPAHIISNQECSNEKKDLIH